MRAVLAISALILTGCLSSDDDLDGYFDSVDPKPQVRIVRTTPLPPADGQTVATAQLPETGGDAELQTLQPQENNQTAEDRRVVNTGSNPPPEYVDSAVQAPEDAGSDRVDPADVDTTVKPLGTRSQSIDLREYARSQRHLVGESKYLRNPTRYRDGGNCARYSVPEVAQIAFLSEGGPQRDKLLLDRDGDGFACGWTPDMAR